MIEQTIEKKQRIFYDSLYRENEEILIYFSKCSSANDMPRFYFSFYEKETLVAYIYFYLNMGGGRTSKFIGMYVAKEKRNEGYAKLLLSTWIQFCLHHSVETIQTIERQRKPFIVYLLKTFGFDLLNEEEKQKDRRKIAICKRENSCSKCLHFHDKNQEMGFINSHIMKEDNYDVLSLLDLENPDIHVLDHILLLKSYISYDNEKTYEKAKQIIKKYK